MFGSIGLLMLAIGIWLLQRQVNIVRSWPEVEATVTQSGVSHYMGDSIMMHSAEIEFRYVVSGREYVTPAPSDYSSSSYSEMKRRADAYPAGSRHTIKYNPEDPNDIRNTARYSFGFFFLPLIFGGLGIVFTGIGVPMFVYWYRGRPHPVFR